MFFRNRIRKVYLYFILDVDVSSEFGEQLHEARFSRLHRHVHSRVPALTWSRRKFNTSDVYNQDLFIYCITSVQQHQAAT